MPYKGFVRQARLPVLACGHQQVVVHAGGVMPIASNMNTRSSARRCLRLRARRGSPPSPPCEASNVRTHVVGGRAVGLARAACVVHVARARQQGPSSPRGR